MILDHPHVFQRHQSLLRRLIEKRPQQINFVLAVDDLNEDRQVVESGRIFAVCKWLNSLCRRPARDTAGVKACGVNGWNFLKNLADLADLLAGAARLR